ncbi:11004_t:CDS:1, partial [Cetraspora pellucida]
FGHGHTWTLSNARVHNMFKNVDCHQDIVRMNVADTGRPADVVLRTLSMSISIHTIVIGH